ncbi:M14 family metallopeptidase [Psychromonas hadalis]|uniref:M14 family metallopeptidase n=1 Tax=Psychromonas hadalis TaxID=211669 RepID=UPI0003B56265|nr:M14 family metallocarboxypeptidase [Psychromonas hadalis]
MKQTQHYIIGSPGKKWGQSEKHAWLDAQQIKRSYKEEVLAELTDSKIINDHFELTQYGALAYSPTDYPLFILKSKNWKSDCKNILITGGVHGYESSGVHGAIRFAGSVHTTYLKQFNFIIAPCVSPWGYATINRWNPYALDPNRAFYADSPVQEATALMTYISTLGIEFTLHIDLHETTDTDNSEFRPALGARDAIVQKNWDIPDGFYLVADSAKPVDAFQKAIINKVSTVTHIAPADTQQRLIGVPLAQFGVINYAARELGLCMGLTNAAYVTTTEVYPDSPLVDDENCINAQVAAIYGALDYLS